MNSLRYLVSSDDDEKLRPIKATLRLPDPPSSLLWRLICGIFPFLGHRQREHAKHGQPAENNGPNEGTTKKKRRKSSTASSLPSIPRLLLRTKRKTLVLDLDETLIHSMTRGYHPSSYMIEVHLRHAPVSSFYYVCKRPYCSEFLSSVLQWYELCVFTASVKEYADPIVDMLEHDLGRRCFKQRFYRDSCTPDGSGSYIKDLRVLGEDLSHVLLVDNSPVSWALQQTNGLGIEGWISDPSDRALLQILPLLYALRHTSDVRSILCLQNSNFVGSLGPLGEDEATEPSPPPLPLLPYEIH